ncbi:MAG: bifunctional 23S rRNA (guanine(2069)-N(7))-methyltransferase RlmK/23S rRNA (guanine(2445)-N(2))-methyltransferase RlmL [Gammaproteobacteria bacterium]|nr:bifunctional 23S rRNA (guanine(2069)-N(7))-methyltransferase RlmK/23S rRNA (guanine(2445)-N(2))-methyltransferase RlmL [Gammaproteobacteria bacterium]
MAVIRKKKHKKSPLQFIATCGSGLETLVENEIISFGGREVIATPGAVSWSGTLQSAYRACLWSRCASRILLELRRFDAPDTDSLYDNAMKVLWDEHFHQRSTFAVSTTLVNAKITHSQFASLRVKDAVVDQFRKRFGKRPNVDSRHPQIRLNLHVEETSASLALDLSGESLHRRGYRATGGQAPLKETLAAAIIKLSNILPQIQAGDYLLDPMCGSGTLLIEAALMLTNSAPGLLRKTFGFSSWLKHDQKLWDKLVEEALNNEEHGNPDSLPYIIGYDADPHIVASARKNIIAAGMREVITIKQKQVAQLNCPGGKGWIITNPPYGDRLSEKLAVKYLYRFIGKRFQEEFKGWHLSFFTGNPDLAALPSVTWQERHKLYNGPIRCQLLSAEHHEAKPFSPKTWELQEKIEDIVAEDFSNRLRKNCAIRLPWAKKNDITCFRIYDRDMPEYNLSIDIYEQFVHVQEYAPPSTIEVEKAEERFNQALQVIRATLGVGHSQIFIKTRKKQKGKDQYQKKNKPASKKEAIKFHEVNEGNCRFLVNFTEYLDTGLFLDHRITRSLIAEYAQGKTFLNLFGYTGSATVYAAVGEATSTTTIDISEKYLNRAEANLSLNGIGGPLHQTIQVDAMEWLKRESATYGMIFVDPPTFSNNRHTNTVFDIQADHLQLLQLTMKRLSLNGTLIFSTNSRKFKLDDTLSEQFMVNDITEKTLPPDFSETTPPHKCWTFTHKEKDTLDD